MLAINVQETTSTVGTGSITLSGASENGVTFTSEYSLNDRFPYYIDNRLGEWEHGVGYLSGVSTLVRETVLKSSNSDALVNFSAGTKQVFVNDSGFLRQTLPLASKIPNLTGSNPYVSFNSANWVPVANDLIIMPHYISQSFTLNYFGIRANGTIDATFRIVLFDGSSGNPGNVIADTGNVTATTYGEKRFATLSSLNLKTGMYYIGFKWWGLNSVGAGGGTMDTYQRPTNAYNSVNPLGLEGRGDHYTNIRIASTSDNVINNFPPFTSGDIKKETIPMVLLSENT